MAAAWRTAPPFRGDTVGTAIADIAIADIAIADISVADTTIAYTATAAAVQGSYPQHRSPPLCRHPPGVHQPHRLPLPARTCLAMGSGTLELALLSGKQWLEPHHHPSHPTTGSQAPALPERPRAACMAL
ncbi:hypothetical protein AAES_131223 [Amazona aestiva]|uniref:Uncharacterized protein n=1 Tax=Amazona aestiva TaxID=12930 RepID=A0A0Q3QUS6_AMAAE|nr:hypothetical protein AAES_131223 [Amazona aestiva]